MGQKVHPTGIRPGIVKNTLRYGLLKGGNIPRICWLIYRSEILLRSDLLAPQSPESISNGRHRPLR